MSFLTIDGHRIEYEFEKTGAPVMVFLHEGLGSVAMWKDFPRRCAHAAGCDALAYSRYGYGLSDPLKAPRRVGFMHDEALRTLPAVLERLDVSRPILLGHSDGGSIALIHAGGAHKDLGGVIVLAPHVMVEDVAIAGIQRLRRNYQTGDLREKLGRYHSNPDSAFYGWSDIWLHPDFRRWNIEEYLPRITCPVLAIQGQDDEYGTMEQLDRIARAAPQTEILALMDCGHSPQRDQPEAVYEAVTLFFSRISK
jgi:pimeloyl-ACP methyl ester carboxylesterase